MSYKLNDTPWHASFESTKKTMTCPECQGQKYLTVILGDGSRVTIDCAGCASGYDLPTGYVSYWEHSPIAKQVRICKVEITSEEIEYGYDGTASSHSRGKDTEFFDTKAEAEARAQEMAEEWNKEQEEKLLSKKEFNHRTWAWHVHYYRNKIRRAKEEIERAERQLDAAKKHVKEV
jgi:hypothetical protein